MKQTFSEVLEKFLSTRSTLISLVQKEINGEELENAQNDFNQATEILNEFIGLENDKE